MKGRDVVTAGKSAVADGQIVAVGEAMAAC